MLTVLNSATRQLSYDAKYKLCIISQINRLKPIGYVMKQQFNFQQLYALSVNLLSLLVTWFTNSLTLKNIRSVS